MASKDKKKKLTIKQEKYCQGLMQGLSQRQAYKQAYNADNMADSTIDKRASELYARGDIQGRLEELNDIALKRQMTTIDRVVAEYAKLAFFNPQDLFHADGKPKSISELDPDTAAAIAGLDVLEQYEGYGDDREYIGDMRKYKLTDKTKALDSLAKFLGMFIERRELSGDLNVKMPEITIKRSDK